MSRYPHWTGSSFQGAFTFWASINKIDETMKLDTFRWALSERARSGGFADFKPGKFFHWKNIILEEGRITPPELTLMGDDKFGVSDGRHRIYALYDEGFTDVLVQMDPMEFGGAAGIERLARLLAP